MIPVNKWRAAGSHGTLRSSHNAAMSDLLPAKLAAATLKSLGCLLLGLLLSLTAAAQASSSVFMEDLTSFELRKRVADGTTTVLIPIGGTEQNGPHITLGKHNVRVRWLAGKIAQQLGATVVAPVLAYVPEGAIFPPAAHMRFTGTLSIPEATFEAILEATAKSLKQHGFQHIFFLGDHGGYQKNEIRAAERLNREWGPKSAAHAHALTAYYDAAQTPYFQSLKNKGYSDHEIGTHAGLADTSLMLAIDKTQVRTDRLAEGSKTGPADGVYGDPRKASAEAGDAGVQLIVNTSVQAIQAARKMKNIPSVTAP